MLNKTEATLKIDKDEELTKIAEENSVKTDDETRERQSFVQNCIELLKIAKPNVIDYEYSNNDFDETVTVTYKNGRSHKISIAADSLCAIAYDIFKNMLNK